MEGDSYFDMDDIVIEETSFSGLNMMVKVGGDLLSQGTIDQEDLVYETGQSQKSYEETKELVNQTSSSVIVSRSSHTHYI